MRILLSLVLLQICLFPSIYADVFIVDSPTNLQNGGNTIDGDDTLKITSNGSITTNGTDAVHATGTNNTIKNKGEVATTGVLSDAISVENESVVVNDGKITTAGGDSIGIKALDDSTITNNKTILTNESNSSGISVENNNTVLNKGAITTTGGSAAAINADSNNTITNTGVITTSGSGSSGIVAQDNNTIINTHSITTGNTSSFGMFLGNNNTVQNTGTISTSGNGSVGIRVLNNNNVTNSGTIQTTANSSTGVFLLSENTFTNTGKITTKGLLSDGLIANLNNTVTNKGEITTFGEDASGVVLTNNNTLTNSGKIVSADAESIRIDAFGNTLNLKAPAFIGGEIDLGILTATTIETGASHSVLWDFSTGSLAGGALSVSGPVPYFYDTASQKFATFDPTVLAAAPDFLADVSGGASYAISNRLIGIKTCCRRPCITPWVSLYGSHFDYEKNHAVLKRDIDYWSVLLGAETTLPCEITAGVLAGYGKGFIEADSRFYHSYKTDADGFVGGGYLQKCCQCVFFNVGLTGGNLCHSDKRYVNDNLASLGEAHPAKAGYHSWWISPEAAIGTTIENICDTTLIPTVRYRYAYQSVQNYHESGTGENAKVHSRDVQVGELKVEALALKKVCLCDVAVKAGYLLRNPIGCNGTKVTLLDQTHSIPSFDNSHSCGYIGGNIALCLRECVNIQLDGEYITGRKMQGYRGLVDLSLKF